MGHSKNPRRSNWLPEEVVEQVRLLDAHPIDVPVAVVGLHLEFDDHLRGEVIDTNLERSFDQCDLVSLLKRLYLLDSHIEGVDAEFDEGSARQLAENHFCEGGAVVEAAVGMGEVASSFPVGVIHGFDELFGDIVRVVLEDVLPDPPPTCTDGKEATQAQEEASATTPTFVLLIVPWWLPAGAGLALLPGLVTVWLLVLATARWLRSLSSGLALLGLLAPGLLLSRRVTGPAG